MFDKPVRPITNALMGEIDAISFFDANASFGRLEVPNVRRAESARDLLDEMDFVGIDEALVWHSSSVNLSPVDANRHAVGLTRPHPRLHPTWVLLPHQTNELGSPEEFHSRMREEQVRALWLRPAEHRWLPTRVGIGSMLDMAAEKKIACFVTRGVQSEAGSGWGLIARLLGDFPGLRLVVTGTGSWGEDRYFRPLLESYPNLYIEISRYELSHGIESLVRFCGHERIVYGSGYPAWTMGGPKMMVATAEISLEGRRAIAGGNIRRLLSEAEV